MRDISEQYFTQLCTVHGLQLYQKDPIAIELPLVAARSLRLSELK